MSKRRQEQIEMHVSSFRDMPDVEFIRAVIRGSRYLDNQSRELAREALKRFNRLHPVKT